MHFCIRDDDTSFFTSPDALERAYGEASQHGPISLAIIPFCRAGRSKGVPEKFRERWSVHPLHKNPSLVTYLRNGIVQGRFEAMLHGYHHDVRYGDEEFAGNEDLRQHVMDGRKYLEDLLGTAIRVFVPPRNAVSASGLRAIVNAKLHLAGTAGVRAGWSLSSLTTWKLWFRLRRWHCRGGVGIPWILDLGDHREIPGNAVTPFSRAQRNATAFATTLGFGGVFCVATHYWELATPSLYLGEPSVGEQLQQLIARAVSLPQVVWRSVGDTVSAPPLLL